MKKATKILALMIGTGLLFSPAVNAINPMQFTGMIMNFNPNERYQESIQLNDWMISLESFTGISESSAESEPVVRSWMLDPSWGTDLKRLASEPELKLEDWMLNAWDREDSNRTQDNCRIGIKG